MNDETARDFLQIVEDTFGGFWEKSVSHWEGRRDGVLELIGKATLGMFRPALTIDPIDAKLTLEALGGRWSFTKERRDQRNIWFHIADAFSLVTSSLEPTDDGTGKYEVKTNLNYAKPGRADDW